MQASTARRAHPMMIIMINDKHITVVLRKAREICIEVKDKFHFPTSPFTTKQSCQQAFKPVTAAKPNENS